MKLLLAAAFLVSLSAPSRAKGQDAAAAKPAVDSSTPAASVAASTPSAAAATADTAAVTTDVVIAKLKALDETVKSLACTFTQSLTITETGMTQESEGKLYYKKPDGLRLEYTKPKKQIAVSDKHDIWIHQVEDNQVIRYNWEDWKKTQFNVTGLLDFGNYSSIVDKHTVEVSAPKDGPVKVTLKPKEKSAVYVLSLTLSRDDFFPIEWSLQLERMTVKTALKDVQRNGDLPAELFKFTPPADAPVINFTAPRAE